VIAMLNADRAASGLRPLLVDTRIMMIAQVRADTMARENKMSHVAADGTSVFELIDRSKIEWYLAGEIIAWNNWPTLADSSAAANRGWMNSPDHHDIVESDQYNYIGVGLATRSDGGRFWSAVFLRGPDRTAPTAAPVAPALSSSSVYQGTTVTRAITWRWTGGDVWLATLTAGLRTFQVERRVDGGAWVLVRQTTGHSYADKVRKGHLTEIRVRGIDRNGNVGAWSKPTGVRF